MPRAQTLRVAWRTSSAWPGMSISCLSVATGPPRTAAINSSKARPDRKAHKPSRQGTTSGEESVSPEHQRRNARDAIAAGFPALVAAPAPPPPVPAACAQSRGTANHSMEHLFFSQAARQRHATKAWTGHMSVIDSERYFFRSAYDDCTGPGVATAITQVNRRRIPPCPPWN